MISIGKLLGVYANMELIDTLCVKQYTVSLWYYRLATF